MTGAICNFIRTEGLSDSAAGSLAGVSTTSISRWKQDDEDFALGLERARAEFERACLLGVREARKRDGTTDWRAYAWLLQNSSADGYGRRAKRTHDRVDDAPAITLEQVEELVQARVTAALQYVMGGGAARVAENGEMIPEIPEIPETRASARQQEPPQAPGREDIAEGESENLNEDGNGRCEFRANLPEIPETPETSSMPRLNRRERRAEERRLHNERKEARMVTPCAGSIA